MEIIEALKLTVNYMLEKKSRVFITLSGIIIGIFTFTFFVFVSAALSNSIAEQFNSLGGNVLGVKSIGQQTGPTGDGLTDKEIQKIRQVVKDINYIAPGIFANFQIENGNEIGSTVGLGFPDEYLDEVSKDFKTEILEGRDIRRGDKSVLVLGNKFAKNAFKNEIKVGNSLKINGESYRVIGILKAKGDLFIDQSISMSFSDIKKIANQETYSVIRISFKEGADLDYYKDVIGRKLNPNGSEKKFEITSSQQVIDQFNQILGLLTGIIGFISSVALLVGGINVMNTMYSNVIERVNEISVMKAMGATNADIISLFLIESSILGFIGALIGYMLSFMLAKSLSILITVYTGYNITVYFDYVFTIEVLLITTIFTALFGTYPAIKAARVNPADNLRDE